MCLIGAAFPKPSRELRNRDAGGVDSAGKVFVTGGYEGTASFGGINLESPGPSSIFLAELAPDSD